MLTAGDALDVVRCRQLATHWSCGLTPDQFLQREQRLLERSAFQQPRVLTAYALVPGDDGEHEDACVASCETYRVTGVVRSSSGDLQEGVLYGIASVFTPQQHRRKGYAARLLLLVRQHLERLEQEAASPRFLGTLLMCEAAPGLYTSLGYVAAPRDDDDNPPQDWEFTPAEPGFEMHSTCKMITAADLPVVAADLAARVKATLAAAPHGAWAVVPTASQLAWHLDREEARRKVAGLPAALATCGAACGRSIVLWALDEADHMAPPPRPLAHAEDRAGDGDGAHVASPEQAAPSPAAVLRILAFLPCDARRDGDDAAVLAAAVQAAHAAGATAALMWDTDGLMMPPLKGACGGGDGGGDSNAAHVTPSASQHAAARWQPPEEELAAMGVAVRRVPRDCKSVPMAHVHHPASPHGWRFIPRAVWI